MECFWSTTIYIGNDVSIHLWLPPLVAQSKEKILFIKMIRNNLLFHKHVFFFLYGYFYYNIVLLNCFCCLCKHSFISNSRTLSPINPHTIPKTKCWHWYWSRKFWSLLSNIIKSDQTCYWWQNYKRKVQQGPNAWLPN